MVAEACCLRSFWSLFSRLVSWLRVLVRAACLLVSWLALVFSTRSSSALASSTSEDLVFSSLGCWKFS